MVIAAEPREHRVTVRLDNDAEEASFVYDLVASGRLQVENKDMLPLPFRGAFLFKLPDLPRPLDLQVARLDPTATDLIAGHAGPLLILACAAAPPEVVAQLETTLRELPPASQEESLCGADEKMDEFTRVRKMTFAQRVIFATRAGQSGRTVLMQQPVPMLLLYLCKNPLITLPELIQIAKLPSINSLVADYIVKVLRSNPQWAMSEELKLAVVTNVKTPGGTALSLLQHLNSKSLRVVARSKVSTSVCSAALRMLTDRRS